MLENGSKSTFRNHHCKALSLLKGRKTFLNLFRIFKFFSGVKELNTPSLRTSHIPKRIPGSAPGQPYSWSRYSYQNTSVDDISIFHLH